MLGQSNKVINACLVNIVINLGWKPHINPQRENHWCTVLMLKSFNFKLNTDEFLMFDKISKINAISVISK